MRQEFDIWGTLDGLNEYTAACRSHRMSGAKMKRDNQDAVCWAIRAAGLEPMRCPVSVHFTWVEGLRPGRKRFVPRDRDNLMFSQKYIFDALQEMGVIRSDSFGDVGLITHKFFLNRENPRVHVVLEES